MRTRTHFTCLLVLYLLITTTSAIAQDGRIVRETVYSPSLEGNLLGDSPNRQVTIYLPPSYDDGLDMAYPVVYLLHGYTGNNNLWTGGSYISGNILNSIKSWLKNGEIKEMILVMPNSYNKFWGSWYTNSVATGGWSDYIARDLVQYIDSNYRTLPQPESRAVIGHSMGGYGGMKIGMLYPDVFSCMGGLAGWYYDTSPKSSAYYEANVRDWAQYNSLGWGTKMMFAIWAAFCPNPDKPPFYCDFPYIYDDNKKIVENPDAYDRYMQHDIRNMVDNHIDVLSNMRAIFIDCGTSDGLIGHAHAIRDKLNSLGVDHVYKEFSGDHTCCVMNSTGDALEVFSNAMAFEMLVGVEAAGRLANTWAAIKSY